MKTLGRENSYSRLPIHLITGFLGSGKTTLLNQLLQQGDLPKTAVIVNEWGDIGIDHLLIKVTPEEIFLLEGGCLCCAVRSDLLHTLEELFHQYKQQQIPAFEQVVIETTGLADPVPILRTLTTDPVITANYRLENVITTVDAVYGAHSLDEYEESVKQVALANHLILTKIDCVTEADLNSLTQRLQRCNPTASLQTVNLQQDRIAAKVLFNNTASYHPHTRQLEVNRWLPAESDLNTLSTSTIANSSEVAPGHLSHLDHQINTFCIEQTAPLHWITLEYWIQLLTRLRGKDLLRVKGLAYTYETDLPVLIQGVQHIFQPPVTLDAWPSEEKRSQIVFITRNISKTVIEQVLQKLIHGHSPIEVSQAALILLE